MGRSERAIEALLQADALADLQADPRLRNILHLNLAVSFLSASRYSEAAETAQKVRAAATAMGDEIGVLRALWLEGRLAAALCHREEALRLLGQARRAFQRRNKSYDVALVLLEEAALLLDQGWTAKVKELAGELTEVFESKGVHREALASLELFRSAAEREEATAELARHLLAFLFRARYDQGLRFNEASILPAAGFGLGCQNLPAVRVGAGACLAEAVGVPPAAVLGERFAPEGGEERPERVEQAGRGQQGQGEGEGDQGASHRRVSCAAPAASLHGPRGPRLQGHGAEKSQFGLAGAQMRPKNRLVRLFRAISGLTQRVFAALARLHYTTLTWYEMGYNDPTPHMDQIAQAVDLTVADGEQILQYADALREIRLRAGRGGVKGLFHDLGIVVSGLYVRLLRLPLPESLPRPEDRQLAGELWLLLKDLPEDEQVAVVRRAEEFQNWALMEICCDESVVQASRDLERAASLARLAQEIAEHVRGPKSWLRRVRGYAAGHGDNILRIVGELKAARVGMEEAKGLWDSGADPQGLLDPGRLLDLEASLLRDERRFQEALDRLEEALPLSRCPARILINKGFTLEVMGEHDSAIEALLQAESLPDLQADLRLRNILHLNLAVSYVQVSRYSEAARMTQQVRKLAAEMGDEIGILRTLWLESRICAGFGLREAALRLLAQARQEFARRSKSYDVALALLEEAVLMLEEGRTGEVKELAGELTQVFESKGVHLEALAALQLFREAAEREEATVELARRVLGYLCRARHDKGLRFIGS